MIYKGTVEASNIPPNWYSWIHFTTDKLPNSSQKKYFWEKAHVPNLTGTKEAYRPKKIIENRSNTSEKIPKEGFRRKNMNPLKTIEKPSKISAAPTAPHARFLLPTHGFTKSFKNH